ncbi:hypothetical protein N9500_04610 [Candidatus Pelagibacter sp.]|nr:hypothetical protein [Candidatus Pelagibacter sp.]
MKINVFFKNIHTKSLVKKKFKQLFNKNINKSSGIILVEFNKWTSTHISIAYASSVLSKKYNSEIHAYAENGFTKLLFGFSFFDKIYIYLNKFFKFKSYSIYSSFGVQKFIELINIDPQILLRFRKNINSIKTKIKNKDDIIKLKLEGVLIGDLIYDTYLRIYKLPTIEVLDPHFIKFLEKSIIYFYFWDNFFKKNKVKGVIVSQAVYNSTIPIRIGLKYNSTCLIAGPIRLRRLTKKTLFSDSENLSFKKSFAKLNNKQKKLALTKTNEMLKLSFEKNQKLSDKDIFLSSNAYRKKSFISKNNFNKTWNRNRLIKKSKRLKILICPHALSDAPHTRGLHLYPDFYEWLISILEISKQTNYDWYIKLHPDLNQYWDNTEKIIKNLLKKKYKHIKYLDNKTPHSRIISEGINFAVTCSGSVCAEYAYFKIPTINSSLSNPHLDFSFSINPKNILELQKILLNLDKVKKNFNKKELLIYFFMSEIYYSDNWLFKNWKDIMEFCSGKNGMYKEIFYYYWLTRFDKKMHDRSIRGLKNFIISNDHRINFNHLGDTFTDQLKSFEY